MQMKVILTQELKGRGHEGDVIEVARGYAANYLFPRKMAIEATPGSMKQLDARMSNISKRNEERRTDAESVAAALNGKTIVIEAKAGEEGKLFGSVTALMIEEAVAAQLERDIDHRRMDLHRPIKTVGEHPVTLSVFGDVKAQIVVKVVPEGGVLVSASAPAAPEAAKVADEPVQAAADVATDEAVQADAEASDAVGEAEADAEAKVEVEEYATSGDAAE
jgi:large subunit ribosomal protein L9